jgi:hypothetical protein
MDECVNERVWSSEGAHIVCVWPSVCGRSSVDEWVDIRVGVVMLLRDVSWVRSNVCGQVMATCVRSSWFD